ncbi:hypothetical protein BZA77DRAFT_361883 [Pyronema omphalodes]|nr:hypothetical protein BZA77DRAFT_361883 [Pyronema omphalodes]
MLEDLALDLDTDVGDEETALPTPTASRSLSASPCSDGHWGEYEFDGVVALWFWRGRVVPVPSGILRGSDSPSPGLQDEKKRAWSGEALGRSIECAIPESARKSDDFEEKLYDISDHINDRFDAVLAKLNDLHGQNAKLRAAYDSTQAETAALKAAVAALTNKIDEQQQVISAPPSPNLTASSSEMKEMTMQLSVVQHDIQDVLDAVRNPPGKRKQRGSDQNTEPTSPTNRRPVNHKLRATSPVRSLMHSKHVTTAAQDKLDALKLTFPLPLLAITSTEATPEPQPDSSSGQDTPLPDAPSTAPAETNGWKTVEAKATQKKKMKAKETTSTAAIPKETPTTKNGGRGKNTHQPRQTTPSAKKTWAEVVKRASINVQIVLGNGNLGLTTPPTRRGERRGGAARRLRKKEGEGERGEEKRGRAGPGVSKGKESGDTSGGVERGEESRGAGGPADV